MLARRVAYVLIVALSLFGIAWAVTNVGFAVGDETPEPRASSRHSAPIVAAPPRESRIDYARIDERLRRLMQRPSMVGLAVGIVEDGEIRFLKGYGETVAQSGDPVTVDTVFRWASVSKGVAGDMVALLASEQRLGLYEPVARYAPSLRLPGGAEHRATVAELLSHRLGIFAHAYDGKLEDGQDARQLRSELATLNLICAPGQCHAYQNVAYDAASEIVERVTGEPYAQVVADRLFRPLGMNSASMTREALFASPSWARPHVGGRNSRPVEVTDSYYRVPAAGGVNSSIADLARWLRAQMGLEPQILPPEVLAVVQSQLANTPGETARKRKFRERIASSSYGLGWRIYDYAGRRVIGHRGGVRGYRSLILFDPQLRSGVVALWNSSTAQPGGLEFEIMDMLYGLPARDWLEVDDIAPAEAEPLDDRETIDEGGGGA